MESLPGYDAWKLATPPEYERECSCDEECACDCGCHDDEPGDAFDTLEEAEMSR